MSDWLVIGGGIRGIFAAIYLCKAGYPVTIIDAAPHLGGVLYSEHWKGFYVDKGCHLLDFGNVEVARVYDEILGDSKHPVNRRYASINRGVKTDGIAVPDLSMFPAAERMQAMNEIKQHVFMPARNHGSLSDLLIHRYGPTTSSYVNQAVRKISTYDASTLAPDALFSLPVERVRLGEDSEMEKLKTILEFDGCLAVSTEKNPLRFHQDQTEFPHRNYYPSKKGMRGLCEAAEIYLESLGVTVLTGFQVENISIAGQKTITENSKTKLVSDRCYWSLPPSFFTKVMKLDNPWGQSAKAVSLVIYTFVLPRSFIGPYTYIHDYSEDTLSFRVSAPGDYGNQQDENGNTYISVEIPVAKESEVWIHPEQFVHKIWNEAISTGIIAEKTSFVDVKVDKMPVAYMLPGSGWDDANIRFTKIAEKYSSRIVFANTRTYGKTDLYQSIKSDLGNYIQNYE